MDNNQNYQTQPVYDEQSAVQQPAAQQTQTPKVWIILSIVAFVAGICSLAICWVGWSALSCAIPAIVLGIVIKTKNGETPKSKTGMTLGIIGAALAIVFGIAWSACACAAEKALDEYNYSYYSDYDWDI